MRQIGREHRNVASLVAPGETLWRVADRCRRNAQTVIAKVTATAADQDRSLRPDVLRAHAGVVVTGLVSYAVIENPDKAKFPSLWKVAVDTEAEAG